MTMLGTLARWLIAPCIPCILAGCGRAPEARSAAPADARGKLPPVVVKRTIRANFPRFRKCYEEGLDRNRLLRGTVEVTFMIGPSGKVDSAELTGGTLADEQVRACVLRVFASIEYPPPQGGSVSVRYPIEFSSSYTEP